MEILFGPNSIDEPNLLYKLQRKIKVFNTSNALPKRGYNLVASSSKYGLVFITTPEGMLCVYYLKQLIDKECEPQHLTIPLPKHPTHIAVNCNQEWLAVISGPLLLVYKCLDFQNQDVGPSVTMQLEINPSVCVSSLQWNPCIPDTIGIVFFDGTLLVSQVSTMQVKKIQCTARCLCWNPKGKQLVTGNSDGTLSQYKPDLSPMKKIPTPNLFEGAPVEALSIYWISTYQIAVSFRNASNNSRPAVTIVNTPKGGSPSCFNYEDICYSMGSNRPWYYYLIGLAPWNIILTSSSNSMEIATLASVDGANWAQWCQSDEARPELPLTDRKQENYPVGICIDTAAVHQLPWGENEVLQPMPLMHVISQTGLLSIFNIINLNKQSPQLCARPQQLYLPEQGLSRDVPGEVPTAPNAVIIPQPKPQIQQVQPPQQSVQSQMQPVQSQIHPAQPQIQPQMRPSPPQQPQPVQAQAPKPMQSQPQPVQQLQQPIIVPKPQIQQPAIPSSKSVSTGVSIAVMKSTTPVTFEAENSQTQKQYQIQVPKSQTASAAVNAALKQEQERISKAKAEQELTQMLIKEVNDFQMELYRFMKSTREKQEKFDQDFQSADLNLNIDMDLEKLKKECEIKNLCENVSELKLDLVRACAVVAEARAHAEANELQDWRQADPLTTKRLASIKKMIYYVQNQLDPPRKALNFKWNDMSSRDQYSKPGERMIRPILDDVYQPLVKQQEILCRQQAVLKSLKKTLNEYNLNPMTKSTSLLRNTPFRNKDPLSKLTKNILNMSIESQTKSKNQLLSSQKLDALRDLLSNHKPIKIKPVNVELGQHLETLKKRYEKSLKEKDVVKEIAKVEITKDMSITQKIEDNIISKPRTPILIKSEPKSMFGQNIVIPKNVSQNIELKKEANTLGGNTFSFFKPTVEASKPDVVKESPVSVPSFSPPSNSKPVVQGVVRTLFTEEPKQEKPNFHQQSQQFQTESDQQSNVSENTKSLLRLKDLVTENKQEIKMIEQKNYANMGQKNCSPTAFGFSKPTSAPAPTTFPKHIGDRANMFNKLEQPISKQSDETGEHEARSPKPKDDRTMTNIFSMKPLNSKNQNVPDIIKTPSIGKDETKLKENSKESLQEKPVEVKKDDIKSSLMPATSKPQEKSAIIVDLKKPPAEAKLKKNSPVIFKTIEVVPSPTEPTAQTSASAISASNEESSKPSSPIVPVAALFPFVKEPKIETKHSNSAKSDDLSKSKSGTTRATVITPTPSTTSFVAILSSPPNVTVTSTNKPTVYSTPIPTSIFDTATTQSSFGNQFSAFVPNSASSIFDTASAAAFGTQEPSFGNTKTVFGTTATATVATSSIFGTSTTQSPVFGSTPSVFSSTGFGTPSTQASLFGSPPTTQSSIFGTPTATQASVFGTSTAQTSVFGSPTSQASVFGSPATTPPSVFGSTTNVSQASVFEIPITSQTSVFGWSEANLFATTNISTTSAPSQNSGENIFRGFTGSVFGNDNTSNLFGGEAAFGSSTCGQTPATDFWSGGEKSSHSRFGTSTFEKTEDNISSKPKTRISMKTEPKSMFGQNIVTPKNVSHNIEFKKEVYTVVPTAQTSASDISASNEERSKPSSPIAPVAALPLFVNKSKTETEDSDSDKQSDFSKSKSGTTTATVITPTPSTTSFAAILSSPPNITVNIWLISDTATTQSSFGNQPLAFVPNSVALVFATASTAPFGTQAPSFGNTKTVFCTTTTATVVTSSIFSKSTTQSPVFGSTHSMFSTTGFGTPSTQASLFGSPPTTQVSVFGTPTTTQASVFGTSTAQTSVFGSPTTTQASVFGSPATTPSSVFGSTNVSQASVFGTPSTTQISLFGGADANLFAAANISTTSAPSQTSGGNIFRGSSGLVFGNDNTTNVFGGESAFGTSKFGQTPATDFWSGGEKSSNGGFGTSTFGQQPTTQSSSIFGTGNFSTPSTDTPFESPGPFSGEKPSVFGTPTQQTATAFGGSPGFGSKPVFGGSPSFAASSFGSGFNKNPSGFGAPASFGGGDGFGTTAFGNTSPSKMFGSSSPGFGSPPQQSNSTFENLATQNTLTFGNLAQQSGQPAPQAPSFNTSPAFTGWRG